MSIYALSSLAKADLKRIWMWIAADNPEAADALDRDIRDACAMLASQPGMGGLRQEWTSRDLRFYVVRKNYWIVYYPSGKPLEILRVIHAARAIAAVLGGAP